MPKIHHTDFIQSFLKAARERGISAVVIAGYDENGKSIMKMSSNAGEEAVKGALKWIASKHSQTH